MDWRPIPGFPGYEASSEGQIRPTKPRYKNGRGSVLKPWIVERHARVAAYVSLHADGVRTKFLVHRLVALAWHGLPPEGMTDVCHLDDDSLNNRAANLKWGTHGENIAQSWSDRVQARAIMEESLAEELASFEEASDVPF